MISKRAVPKAAQPAPPSAEALLAENRALRQKLRQREAFDAIQKKKEDASQSSRALFRTLLQSSPVVFYAREPYGEFGFTYVSENLRSQFGYLPSEIMKAPKAWESRLHFEDAPRIRQALAEALPLQGRMVLEYRLLAADGRYRWIQDHVRLVRNPEGRALEIAGSWLDVTDRVHLEESLTLETERFHQITEAVAEVVWTCDAEGNVVAISPSVRDVFGYAPEDLLANRRLWWKRIRPDDVHRVKAAFRTLIDEGRPYVIDYQFRKSDDVCVTVREKGIVRRDVGGEVLADGTVVEVARERENAVSAFLEERKRLQEALQRSEERFRLLVETAPIGIVVYEPVDGGRDFVIKDFNRTAEKIEGVDRADVVGRSLLQAFPGIEELGLFEVLQRVGRTGVTEHLPARLYKDARISGWRENFVHRMPSGEVVAAYRDITAEKQAEEEAALAHEKCRKMLAAALESIASVSEMRDPHTRRHQERTARLARAIAEEIGLPRTTLEDIYLAAMLHDIGTVGFPPGILDKPGKLTGEEFALLKEHTRRGGAIVKEAGFPATIVAMVLRHHERLDGSGYPGDLKGDAIGIEAMCLAVADVVEAMCADRAHRPAPGLAKALEEIERNAGILYDPRVAAACLRIFREKGFTL